MQQLESRAQACYASRVIWASVHFHGPIDRRGHPQDHRMQLQAGSTVETLLLHLGYPETQMRVITAMIRGEKQGRNHALADGDVVEIFVVASGG